MTFQGDSGGTPVTKQSGGALQHAKYIIKPAGIKGYAKTRMQTTKIRKSRLQYDFVTYNRGTRTQARGNHSQPGGPCTEGPVDISRK